MIEPESPRGGIWFEDPFRRQRDGGLLGLRRLAARAAAAGLAGRMLDLPVARTGDQGNGAGRIEEPRP